MLLSSLISVAVNHALFRIELNSEWFKTTFGSVVLAVKGANQRCVLLLISGYYFGILLRTASSPFPVYSNNKQVGCLMVPMDEFFHFPFLCWGHDHDLKRISVFCLHVTN